ncbi:vinorine synthase-like [Senna tora]|uniref:Vinorine synthase-like n=1 Tax=Senna tora TaxID=362788 RepID=A0A834TPJ3_9FABA|nr:vinorine synthase-like [Senna tora]
MAGKEEVAILKAEIVSKTIVKQSSPTPSHLRHLKLSFIDQLVPPSFCIPILLFYSASESNLHDFNFTQISENLKSSLSQILTLYYPFCGTIIVNDINHISYVDCNDNGVVYQEARISSTLSDLLATRNLPQFRDQIMQFLPFDPYTREYDDVVSECDRGVVMMGVQVSEFACGSVAVGACISHVVCDGATMVSFLGAWSEKARATMMAGGECGGGGGGAPMKMEGPEKFPARSELELSGIIGGQIGERNIVTRRMVLSERSVSELREGVCGGDENKYTRVEVVTALIWKTAMEAKATVEGAGGAPPAAPGDYASIMLHAVNIRRRMVPPLSENAIGNLWQPAVSPLVEIERSKAIEVKDLAQVVRETIRKIDGDYLRKLEGEDSELGFYEMLKSFSEALFLVAEKGIPCYSFNSWLRFEFYEAQFGWGKPTWVCFLGVPTRNVIFLLPTKCGDGVEAWVTLNNLHMAQFEKNPYLLRFASFDP